MEPIPVDAGPHRVQVVADGYEPFEGNFHVDEGDSVRMSVAMRPRCGEVGDEVTISGKNLGEVLSIAFGEKNAPNFEEDGKKKVKVTVPGDESNLGKLVSVTFVTSDGETTLFDAFTYAYSKNCDRPKHDAD